MKILHINCNYIGTTLHQLMVEELDRRGIENEVFVPTYNKDLSVIKPNKNVYVSECFKKWDRIVFDYKQKKILRAIEEHYDVSEFDLIHAYTLFTDGNVARQLSKKYGIPYVVAVRNTDVNDFFKHMIHLRKRGVKNLLAAQKVFFLSESYRKTVFERYIPQMQRDEILEKVEIIPNGIDSFWFDNCSFNENKKLGDIVRLVYAGGIDKNKNITATQAAMRILKSKGIPTSLTVVGKIKDKKVYDIISQDPNTQILPATDKYGLIKLYREADLFVMPSIAESFGLVYAEAMTQGLPVIYTAGQGFDRQFEEGTVGYSVDCFDPEDIANKIIKCLNNYSYLRSNLKSVQKFKWTYICGKYYTIYQELTEN